MRNDQGRSRTSYVRQAIALTPRPARHRGQALFKGQAVAGQRQPVRSRLPRPPTTACRSGRRTSRRAKQLLAQAGVPNGFSTPLLTETIAGDPALRADHQAVREPRSASTINLTIETPTKYYGKARVREVRLARRRDEPGRLRRPRGAEHVSCQAPLQSINAKTGQGAWNAARFNNPTYDKLSKQFIATLDLSTQKQLAGQIQHAPAR